MTKFRKMFYDIKTTETVRQSERTKREVPVRTPPEGKEYNANRGCLNS